MTQTLLRADEPILIDSLTWREFKAAEQLIDRPGVRLSFLDGILEIRRMPGEKHETIKERIGTLLDLYLLQLGIDYTPTGAMTLESEEGLVKREADKSYKFAPSQDNPDLAIEVVITSGGIDELKAYRRLRIPEVWFWQNGEIAIYRLRKVAQTVSYEKLSASDLLPGLNIDLLSECINIDNHVDAVRLFRRSLLN